MNTNRGTRRVLKKILPKGSVLTDLIHRYSYARDAGFYRLLPRMVVKAKTVTDISTLFQIANQKQRHVVFRAGGTSLSGQSITDDILVEVKQGWRDIQILVEGRQVKLQPGVVAARANQYLEHLGYCIGPDPGSIKSALIGGIVANNASGIRSGIKFNSYQTLVNMEMVLPNGLILNSENPQEDSRFSSEAPNIYAGLSGLRDQIRSNESLSQRIREKYKLKNTMGYALNSFLDFDSPLDILTHLMVGSEGTLGFISSVTLNTVPLQKYRATAILMLPSLTAAARLVPRLKKVGSAALEIMDDAALKAVANIEDLPAELKTDLSGGFAALLIEYEADDQQRLNHKVEAALEVIGEKYSSSMPRFSSDPGQREKLWKARRELGPLHAASRVSGTTLLSEDVCFKVKDLARAIKDLQVLFRRYQYKDAVIFGHAGDGNLHFKLSLDLPDSRALDNYSEFMKDLVELVIDKYDGSLKAEHGTGRNMAPFVEREWGPDAYQIMHSIKRLLDPNGILNPDVLLSGDDQIHIKNIKSIPLVDPKVDACIECGLCEPICPSEDFSFTPRQRISVLREMEVLKADDRTISDAIHLQKAYQFMGVETCAVDGLCAVSCPVNIDTGSLMKQFRADRHSLPAKMFHRSVQRNFPATMLGVRIFLRTLTPLKYLLKHEPIHTSLNTLTRLSKGRIPALNHFMKAATGNLPAENELADVIYFPACLTRILGTPDQGALPLADAFVEILEQAGIKHAYPEKVSALCCGLSFSSKGYSEAALQAAIQTTEMLWISSNEGQTPIVMDTSPCTRHLQQYDQILSGTHLARWRALKIYDVIEYLHDVVLDSLSLWHIKEKIVLHVSCSTHQAGLDSKMKAIASRCAKEVVIPRDGGCCGFAGDRGLLVPELTASATAMESAEVQQLQGEGHYSTSRTCEMGMTLGTGADYQSLVYLVHDAMIKPKE